MLFRKVRHPRRKLMLFPLMDMFFILLLYFLVTASMEPEEETEPGVFYSIPKQGIGGAQILIQMIDQNSILWLDNTCFSPGWSANFDQHNSTSMSTSDLREKLENYLQVLECCAGKEILAVIRCPQNLVYGDVQRLEQNLQAAWESLTEPVQGHLPVSDSTIIPQRKITYSLVQGEATDIVLENIETLNNDSVRIEWPVLH